MNHLYIFKIFYIHNRGMINYSHFQQSSLKGESRTTCLEARNSNSKSNASRFTRDFNTLSQLKTDNRYESHILYILHFFNS